jgi:hypothetical protein
MGEIGVITEQGDLGLGFEEINDKDKAIIESKQELDKAKDATTK